MPKRIRARLLQIQNVEEMYVIGSNNITVYMLKTEQYILKRRYFNQKISYFKVWMKYDFHCNTANLNSYFSLFNNNKNRTIRRYNPEDNTLHSHCCGNFKFNVVYFLTN
jgi:hypothetical protein